MLDHIKRWNKWRKFSEDSRIYKLGVLLGIAAPLSFELTLTDEEESEVRKSMERIKGKCESTNV